MVQWPFRRGGRQGGPWGLEGLAAPWEGDRQSILDWIAAHDPDDELGTLPDEIRVIASNEGLKFAPGVFDQMMHIHEDPSGGDEHAGAVQRAMKRLAAASTDRNLRAFYDTVIQHPVRDTVDPLMARVIGDPSLDFGRAREIGRWLAHEAPDRDAVKLGIVILHATRCSSEVDTLITLARHEEFGAYAVPAIAELAPNPQRLIFELAKRQKWWGKVYLVQHLAGATDPDIKDWLIDEGWNCEVMDHSAALVCAETGGLLERIQGDDVDPKMVITAGELIIQLFMSESMKDGPGISEYRDGVAVVARYLALVGERPLHINHWRQVDMIHGFMTGESRQLPASLGWTDSQRQRFEKATRVLLDRSTEWDSLAIAAMESDDEDLRRSGSWVGDRLRLDTWPYEFRWAEDGTNEHWIGIFGTHDEERLRRAVAFAESRLDLARLGTGPAVSRAPMLWEEQGELKGQHDKLESVLVALRRLPGEGWALVETGLKSPSVRVRRAAVVAISRSSRGAWPTEADAALRRSLEAEPDPEIRELMERALAGEALEDQYDQPSPFGRAEDERQ